MAIENQLNRELKVIMERMKAGRVLLEFVNGEWSSIAYLRYDEAEKQAATELGADADPQEVEHLIEHKRINPIAKGKGTDALRAIESLSARNL